VAGLVVAFGVLAGGGYLLWMRGAARQPVRAAAVPVLPVPATTPAPPPAVTPAASPTPAANAPPNLDSQLDFAHKSLAAKRWDAAIVGAQAVLMIEPGNQEAKVVLAKAQAAQLRARQKLAQTPREPQPSETLAATTPVIPVTAVTRNPGDLASPVATTASLRVHLVSDFPDGGVIIVSVSGKELMRKNFAGSRHGGFFSRKSEEKRDFNWPFEVSPGAATLHVHVAPAGKPAFVRDFPFNFTGGTSHAAEFHLAADGQVGEASLR
jgi:hypothetical protein